MGKQKPVKKYRASGIEVAIWQNEKSYSVSFKKSYYDKQAEDWKDSDFLFDNELPILSMLLQFAFAWIIQNPIKKDES